MGEERGCKARRKETACLEGYKASVAPFCGLFSLHKKSSKMDDYHLTLRTISCIILTSFRSDLSKGESSPWS